MYLRPKRKHSQPTEGALDRCSCLKCRREQALVAKKLGLKKLSQADFVGKTLLPRALREAMKRTLKKGPSVAARRRKR
jgi:hypothetical protein